MTYILAAIPQKGKNRMEHLNIQKATERDRSQIANIISVCYEKEFSTLIKDMAKVASALSPGIQIPRFYTAELNGEIIGITACSDHTGRAVHIDRKACRKSLGIIKGTLVILFLSNEFMHSLPYPKDTGYIEFVGVLPTYQGRSVARRMINTIIETSEYQNFILDVTDVNIPAQKCYQNIGFQEFKRTPEKNGKTKGFDERIFMEYKK